MTKILCFGSINVDLFYDVPHIPAPGETLSAAGHSVGLGGKGANQSTAIAKAGGDIEHIGAVGQSSEWVLERLEAAGVGTTHVAVTDVPTGQAIIRERAPRTDAWTRQLSDLSGYDGEWLAEQSALTAATSASVSAV